MIAVHIERMKVLLNCLRFVSDDKFSLDYWWNAENKSGCPIGHAAQTEAWKSEGFCLIASPIYKRKTGLDAVCTFLEISIWEARYLFLEESYVDSHKQYVLERIQLFYNVHLARQRKQK